MNTDPDPQDELARLAAGFGAVLDRRRRSGHRHLPQLGSASLAAPEVPEAKVAVAAPPQRSQSGPQTPVSAYIPKKGEAAPPGGETGRKVDRFAAPARIADPERGAERPSGQPSPPAGAPSPAAERAPRPAAAAAKSPAAPAAHASADATRRAELVRGLAEPQSKQFIERLDRVATAARSARDLGELREGVAACRACRLCEGRTQTVFADGSASARVMFIGEGPGAEEDRTGLPFVGAAGQLLTSIIERGMRLERENDVYIANVVKCRPPENRDPTPHEKAICSAWLERQIELVDPELIIPLGGHAANQVLSTNQTIGRLRGRVHRVGDRKVVATYHPAWVLHQPAEAQPAAKHKIWSDIQLAMSELGL